MNDLQYIFYDAKRMALDTQDMSPMADLSHRRLFDHICYSLTAPRNRDVTLRQIAHASEADWPAIKAELLEKGWVVSGDFLIHRGSVATVNASTLRYVANFNRQCAMNKKAPLVPSEPDPVTGIIVVPGVGGDKRNVTRDVTVGATPGWPIADAQWAGAVLDGKLAQRVVSFILRNESGWCYDNCKIRSEMFVAKALETGLRPYQGKLSGKVVLAAWDTAAVATHRAVVDGLVKDNAAGYCVKSWQKLLDAETAKAEAGKPKPEGHPK